MEYFSILTTAGLSKLINATANSQEIKLTQMGVSDDGSDITQDITSLPSEKYKFNINSITKSSSDENVLICEGVILAEVGGFYIRKVGVYTQDGELFAIGRVPETYKPLLNEGSAKDITIKFYLQVDNSANITLKVDNNVVLATRNFVGSEIKKLDDKFALKSTTYTKNQSDDKFAFKEELIPAGTIIQSAGKLTPTGYLKCNGAAISRTGYKKLFDEIGTTFGEGDGESTFNLPDLRGKFIRGFDDGAGVDTGREFGSYQEDDLKRHTHAFVVSYSGHDNWVNTCYDVVAHTSDNLFADAKDGDEFWHYNAVVKYKDQETTIQRGTTHKTKGNLAFEGNSPEVRVKNIALNFYIKY